MSGSISQYGNSGMSALMRQAVSVLSTQEQSLQLQTSTGVASDSYAGLGDTRTQALSLQPAITQVSAWSANVTSAQGQLSVTQTALGEIGSIASSLSTTLTSLSGTPTQSTVQTAATQAAQDLQTLGSLLDTKSGSTYVFAGAQSQTAPVGAGTDLATGSLATAISSTVGQLGTLGADGVLDQTLDLAGSTTANDPFSAGLSVSPQDASKLAATPALGQNQTMSIGVVATQGSAASSTSTGSPIRDLMRNLMVVASLGQTTAGSSSYNDLISGLTTSTSSVSSNITAMSASVGVTQNSLTTHASMLSQMTTSLTTQLGTSKDADLATVSTQLSSIQDDLQASYSVIADMKGMTLADYI
ncbi:flagellin [Tanticharoenia sakaeratensis]|uniref:Flagellar hook-associated protein FlgL n=1 Tax=Tanticharoenia sakaeratensis NBRC 103193 TaxID=1231623 RepID=A0A0D6MJZ8_9PROT|nr:flagellin [Tanticharoenia sakaeratensis]GAN53796.1 flagellar hook-associated protein FlgL [Tanticharoenia sakaeratensis NBRC 103193]GBQ22342.1 flagellar hook-associated protein FlgL [Tanticharoenia sakaeratensis NBRC 103193]